MAVNFTMELITFPGMSFRSVADKLSFLGCSERFLIDSSLPTAFSSSHSSLFNEVLDAFSCSMMCSDEGLRLSSNDDNLLFSKNDEEVVVVLDKSSSILFAKGTEADDVVGFLSSTSSS